MADRTLASAALALRNDAEFFATTRFPRAWRFAASRPRIARSVNRVLIDRAVSKMPPRPDPLSTLAPYTSWESLTDRRWNGRHLPPVAQDPRLPAPEALARELFARRRGHERLCPKSTVLFAYFAQWATDGFLRSDRARPPDPRKNQSTHEIDVCQVYGVAPQTTRELRLGEGGLLRSRTVGGEELPPLLHEGGVRRFEHVTVAREEQAPPERRGELLAIGTDTGNVQLGHVLMNVLWLREHNRVARLLAEHHRDWDDERLFQTARNVLIVLVLKIVVEEYINHIAPYHFAFRLHGAHGHQRAPWMRTNRMTIEFNLLYRWHSLIPSRLRVGGEEVAIASTFFNPGLLVRHGLGPLLEEASRQPAGRIGLFNTAPELLDTEVASIRRGRLAHLAGLNAYRAHCAFPRAASLREVSGRPEVRAALARAYGDADRIELYPGLFAEDTRPNSVLPSLMGRMVGIDAFSQALTNPLLAPRVFHRDTFSDLGWETIHATRSLADVVERNTPGTRRHLVTMTRTDWVRT